MADLKTQTTINPDDDPKGYIAELEEMLAERGGSHPGIEAALRMAKNDLANNLDAQG